MADFSVGEFAVFEVVWCTLYRVVMIAGEKQENGWPVIFNDTGEPHVINARFLFKINWERKMENSPIERAVQALESIAKSLESIDATIRDSGEQICLSTPELEDIAYCDGGPIDGK